MNRHQERRQAIEARQQWAAELIRAAGTEGLLVLDPANLAYFTAGASVGWLTEPDEQPALFLSETNRWLIASNVDSQYLFDENLDSLGFLLKEWPWWRGRACLLNDLGQGRRLAVDRDWPNGVDVGDALRARRRCLDAFDQARLRAVADQVVHALEATGRNLEAGESESQIAGQIVHRLVQRGLEVVRVQVSADGRCHRYRRHNPSDRIAVTRTCGLEALAGRDGLFVQARRELSLGEPDSPYLNDFDAACRLSVAWLAAARSGVKPSQLLSTGRAMLRVGADEHEWRLSPAGVLLGYTPCEGRLAPGQPPLDEGCAVAWQARVGSAASCDTTLITADGVVDVTPVEDWPVRRIRWQGRVFDRPDILRR